MKWRLLKFNNGFMSARLSVFLAPFVFFTPKSCRSHLKSSQKLGMAKKETGIQFLARLGSRPTLEGLEPLLFATGPRAKDVVELYGGDGTGKTELLLHLVARMILPSDWQGVPLDGHGAGVIFIDTDYKFSILQLTTILERLIHKKVESHKKCHRGDSGEMADTLTTDVSDISIDLNDIEECIKHSLARLYVVRCENSSQLVLSLHNLETVICNDPSLSALVIDSISAFYWIDRFCGGESVPAQESNMKHVAHIVEKLVSTYSLTVFVSKAMVYKKKLDSGVGLKDGEDVTCPSPYQLNTDLDQYHAEFMCKAWQYLVTHRLVLVSVYSAVNQITKYMIGGDCAQGNRLFTINATGIQFE